VECVSGAIIKSFPVHGFQRPGQCDAATNYQGTELDWVRFVWTEKVNKSQRATVVEPISISGAIVAGYRPFALLNGVVTASSGQ
jgi:hypothetical protein